MLRSILNTEVKDVATEAIDYDYASIIIGDIDDLIFMNEEHFVSDR